MLLTTFGSRPLPILPSYRKGDKAMHDVNPLGVTMYLKELERQATAPKLEPVLPERESPPTIVTIIARMVSGWRGSQHHPRAAVSRRQDGAAGRLAGRVTTGMRPWRLHN
jgi:hypothetical protein